MAVDQIIHHSHLVNEKKVSLSFDSSSPFEASEPYVNDVKIPMEYTECRRSSRIVKKPCFFMSSHQQRRDPELVAAIKRSKVETRNVDLDYTNLSPVPTIYATMEEFRDPIKLWNTYSHLGEQYGAIKVVPPAGWKAQIAVDLEKFNFNVRQQQLDLLLSGKGFSHPQGLWNSQMIRQENDKLLNEVMNCSNPDIAAIEAKYWKMVKSANEKVTTYYGADLNVYSDDLKVYSNEQCDDFRCDPWNLRNLPNCQGSLLRYLSITIPGVNSPWIYIGMCFTSFCWHTEDNYFGAVNYHHFGDPKIWYVIPPKYAKRMENLLKNYIAIEGEEFAIYSLRVQIPPDVLLSNDIPVNRLVQNENEFVFVWPRTFHSGFNVGYNCNEACNVAPSSWITMGYQSLLNYKYARKTCIPFYSIIMTAVPSFKDFDEQCLDNIIEMLSALIVQEYRNRTAFSFRILQMYLDLDDLANLINVQRFLKRVPPRDFDAQQFVNALLDLENRKEDIFLNACKELSYFCMKDCDYCDSPTFGCCLMCTHINTTVCVGCKEYHDCHCKNRFILYRFTLQGLYKVLSILKGSFQTRFNREWKSRNNITIPKLEDIVRVDESSKFRVGMLPLAAKNASENCTNLMMAMNDSIIPITENDDGQVESTNKNVPCNLPLEMYNDIEDSCLRILSMNSSTPKRKRGTIINGSHDEILKVENQIRIKSPQTISRLFSKPQLDKVNIITVTKLTLKYIILSLEEDRKESAV